MKSWFCKNKKLVKNIVILGLAYATGLSLAMVHGYRITDIEVIVPCLMALAAVVYFKAASVWESVSKRDKVMSAAVGFVFALTLLVGGRFDFYNNEYLGLPLVHLLLYPFLGLFFAAVVMLLFVFRDKYAVVHEAVEKPYFRILFLVNLVCYLPYYLTFFPGNCGNDTWYSLSMIEGLVPWSNHHPVLFTGLMMLVVKGTAFLGSLTLSIAIFSILQMVSLAAVLAYMTMRICKTSVVWPVKAFAVLMCAFHPFMGMYSIYLTKDVVFAEIMVLLCLKIYDVVKGDGEAFRRPSECVKLAVLFLLSTMLRNNGIYIAVVMAVVFLLLYKRFWKQILLVFVCVIGLFRIWYGPVQDAMGIEKQSFAEAASVPLQQVGYVLWEGKEFSAEDMAFLEKIMPAKRVKEVFQPGFTDPYKFDEQFNDEFFNENTGEFLKVWSHGLVPYFGEYVEAYLHQTLGYWYYGATNTVATQGCTENNLGVTQIDVIKNISGFSLEPIFENAILAGRKAPVVCILGSMAMQMFMILLLALQYFRSDAGKRALWLLPLILLWGTLMVATPAFCLLRYLFPVFLLWPFMIAEFFAPDEAEVV